MTVFICHSPLCVTIRNTVVSFLLIASMVWAAEPLEESKSDLPELLHGFDEYVERVLDEWHIPGAAIGVIRDGEIIAIRAYGVRDVETKEPVTVNTLFPIGSNTKAFTATGLGMLVDEGKLDWDDPIRNTLPEFQLYDEYAGAHTTTRDLLSHRTGVPTMEMGWWWGSEKWLEQNLTRREMMRRLKFVRPTHGFRERYDYSNEMYAVAGLLFEPLSDATWEEFTQQRILKPLGMNSTYLHAADVPQSAELATGHYYHHFQETYSQPGFYPGKAIGPAGSIVSNVPDMLKWIRFHIRRGRHNQDRLLSVKSANDLVRPMLPLADVDPPAHIGAFYGMGFLIFGETSRKKWVQHAGQLSNCTSLTGFVPAQKDGFVILTNWTSGMGYTPLQVIAANLSDRFFQRDIRDRLKSYRDIDLTEWKRIEKQQQSRTASRTLDTSPSHPLQDYTGVYSHAVLQKFEINVDADKLVGVFHGKPVRFQHRHFDVFDIKIGFGTYQAVFHTNSDGKIDRLSINLGPNSSDVHFRKRKSN